MLTISSILLCVTALIFASFVLFRWASTLRWLKTIRPQTIDRAELAVILLLFATLAFAIGKGTTASFSVAARSEAVQVDILPDDEAPRWPAPDRLVSLDAPLPSSCASPALQFRRTDRSRVDATFTVLGPEPAPGLAAPTQAPTSATGIVVNLEADEDQYGLIICADGKRLRAPARLTLEYQAHPGEAPPTLAVEGRYKIGGTASNAAEAEEATAPLLLLSGALSVEAESWPIATGRARVQAPLQLGDVVRFTDGKDPVAAAGLIRADRDALSIVAHAYAEHAEVSRARVSARVPIVYAPTIWSRIQAMNEWNIFILLGALLLALLNVGRRLFDRPPPPSKET